MGSLAQKVDTLRVQLGLVDGLPFAESVNVAVFQLGLADQVKGFNLVQKADACLTALGTPSASAAAAPVAPSASAAAARDVLIGLPVGAAQAPMEIGRTAEESGTYTQPAVAPAPQEIAPVPQRLYPAPFGQGRKGRKARKAAAAAVTKAMYEKQVKEQREGTVQTPYTQPAQSVVEPVYVSGRGARFRTTDMIGGRTGVGNKRAGSAVPRLVEYPTMNELRAMPREQLEAFHFSRIAMVVRGALDGLQFWRSDTGTSSSFYGACPSLNGSAARFGDVRSQVRPMALGPGVRSIIVYYYKHDVTGLAFLGEGGELNVLAQQGPGGCRNGFGQQRVDLGVTEKLVGFRFYTDHSTPKISFIIADMGSPQQMLTPYTQPAVAPAPQHVTRDGPGGAPAPGCYVCCCFPLVAPAPQHATRDGPGGAPPQGADVSGLIKTKDVEGCWVSCCFPLLPLGALYRKTATGPDSLKHAGVCLPLLIPYKEHRLRVPGTNDFRYTHDDCNVDKHESENRHCNGGLTMSIRIAP